MFPDADSLFQKDNETLHCVRVTSGPRSTIQKHFQIVFTTSYFSHQYLNRLRMLQTTLKILFSHTQYKFNSVRNNSETYLIAYTHVASRKFNIMSHNHRYSVKKKKLSYK